MSQERRVIKSAVDTHFDNAQNELIQFVNEKIQLMEEKLLFQGDRTPSLYELNLAMASYESILLSLTAMYQTARWEVVKTKEAFDEWYALQFITIRDEVNPRNSPATKYYSAKEIEYMVIANNKNDHAKFKAAVSLAEHKKSMLSRMIEGWKGYQFILTQLSKNSIAEMEASLRDRPVE